MQKEHKLCKENISFSWFNDMISKVVSYHYFYHLKLQLRGMRALGSKSNKSNITLKYLACERKIVFVLLMISAGMMGVYTLKLRGGVFCNAQTANFAMMSIAFGGGNWQKGFYYFIPISAYLLGTVLSEILPSYVKKAGWLRWDTYLVGFEIAVLFIIGYVPLSTPHFFVQIAINFICSMQYNTFRQAEHVPMATTFCTNHLRQTGVSIAKYLRRKDRPALNEGLWHIVMLASFCMGGIIQAICCDVFQAKAIWFALIPLILDFGMLVYADTVRERDLLQEIPAGH